MDLYRALGIERDATVVEIKRAYRRMAKRMHPDVGGSAEDFERIRVAHDVLTNEARRAQYDTTGVVPDIETEKIDPLQGEALQIVAQMLEELFAKTFEQGHAPEVLDIPRMLAKSIREDVAHVARAIQSLENAEKRLEGIAERFFVRGEHDNVLRNSTLSQKNNVASAIERMRSRKSAAELALTIVDRHGYRLDPLLQTPLRGNATNIVMEFGGVWT